MLQFLLYFITSLGLAQTPNGEERVNRHLQETYQKKHYEQKRGEYIREKYEGQRLNKKDEDKGSYGVRYHAPAEQLPSFDEPAPGYENNPLESVYLETEQEKRNQEALRRQRQKYINDYIRNAKKDGVEVHIDEQYIVDDYKVSPKRNEPLRKDQQRVPGQEAGN